MIFSEKAITLKNDLTAVLKTPEREDAHLMLEYIKTVSSETEFLNRSPEDCDNTSIEDEEKWIESMRASKNTLMIACYIDGRVAGNCQIAFMTNRKSRHRASIGIAIRRISASARRCFASLSRRQSRMVSK